MATIYQKAERVLVWLGHGDGDLDLDLDRAVAILQSDTDASYNQLWDSLSKILRLPWFTRTWVMQEVALARDVVVFCGNTQLSWDKFMVLCRPKDSRVRPTHRAEVFFVPLYSINLMRDTHRAGIKSDPWWLLRLCRDSNQRTQEIRCTECAACLRPVFESSPTTNLMYRPCTTNLLFSVCFRTVL